MSYTHALIDRLLIVRWGPAEISDVDALLRDSQESCRLLAGRQIITIMIMPPEIPAPEGDVRNAMNRRASDLLECNESLHCVIEGDGFKNSIKRSVTTSVLLLSGKRGKMAVHKTLQEALEALRPRLNELGIQALKVLQVARAKGLITSGFGPSARESAAAGHAPR
jgi:hypothetical protein